VRHGAARGRAAGWAPLYFAAVFMANIASQEKRIRRSERERQENRRRTSTVKTYFRRLEQAVATGDADAIEAEHRTLVSMIDKAAEHGALHRNNAARKKSRAARIRSAAGQS
jgi:small subunit ribosomal protein S20